LTSYTTHEWPSLVKRRTRLAPIRPRPIIPSCIRLSPCWFWFNHLLRHVAAFQAKRRSIKS